MTDFPKIDPGEFLDNIREMIARYRAQIEEERHKTWTEIERERDYWMPSDYQFLIRRKWNEFHERTYHLEREMAELIRQMVAYQSLTIEMPVRLRSEALAR